MPTLPSVEDHLGIMPEAAVVIGDNDHDVHAARAAGARVIAVTYGYSHRPRAELGAEHLIKTIPELLPLIGNTTATRHRGPPPSGISTIARQRP
jgi:phosphoglycolate phosphatase